MQLPFILKAGIASFGSGTITQSSGFVFLYFTKDPIMTLLYILIVGNILGFFTQGYIHGYGPKSIILDFVIKWLLVASFGIFLNYKIFNYLSNEKHISEFKNKYKDVRLDIINYSLILTTIGIVFLIWNYHMRKRYVFVEYNNPYLNLLILIIISSVITIDRFLIFKSLNKNLLDTHHFLMLKSH